MVKRRQYHNNPALAEKLVRLVLDVLGRTDGAKLRIVYDPQEIGSISVSMGEKPHSLIVRWSKGVRGSGYFGWGNILVEHTLAEKPTVHVRRRGYGYLSLSLYRSPRTDPVQFYIFNKPRKTGKQDETDAKS